MREDPRCRSCAASLPVAEDYYCDMACYRACRSWVNDDEARLRRIAFGKKAAQKPRPKPWSKTYHLPRVHMGSLRYMVINMLPYDPDDHEVRQQEAEALFK